MTDRFKRLGHDVEAELGVGRADDRQADAVHGNGCAMPRVVGHCGRTYHQHGGVAARFEPDNLAEFLDDAGEHSS